MRRREFISMIGSAAAWPLAARAQQSTIPVIGLLSPRASSDVPQLIAAVRQGLKDSGYVEGQNVTIEYRFADHQNERLAALAADLVHRQVTVIVATAAPAAVAARAATTSIPIIFEMGDDPVRSTDTSSAILSNNTMSVAHTLGLELHVLNASTERDFDNVFANLTKLRAGGLVINPDAFFSARSEQLAVLALRHAVPAIFENREFVAAGGLASYGGSLSDAYRLAGVYAARVLKGEKPGDLPVQQATKVELFLNLKTAKALGITVLVVRRAL
jgi:putative ABC transport system substrate-binding protein